MTAFAFARTFLLPAVICFAGCASGPDLPRAVSIETGKPTRVVLEQVAEGQTFLLQNASSTDAADFYDGDMPASAKIAPDAQLQLLLDILAQKGMFAGARTASADAREALVVEHGGQRWVWARRRGDPAEATSFLEAQAYFLEVYNHSQAYHRRDDVDRTDLKTERDRLRREAEDARRRQGERP